VALGLSTVPPRHPHRPDPLPRSRSAAVGGGRGVELCSAVPLPKRTEPVPGDRYRGAAYCDAHDRTARRSARPTPAGGARRGNGRPGTGELADLKAASWRPSRACWTAPLTGAAPPSPCKATTPCGPPWNWSEKSGDRGTCAAHRGAGAGGYRNGVGRGDEGQDREAEARRKPKWTPDPELSVATSAICKDVDAYHRELEGLPPSPDNELTDEERAFGRRATRSFLPYLLDQRENAHPSNWPQWTSGSRRHRPR
jgi:hypothetical protein